MKANRIHAFGGPEVILFEDVPRPTPAAGEVLVRVHAAGVGPWDAWVRAGRSAIPQPLPLTLGADLAGTVVTAGSSDSPFSAGAEVFGVTNPRFTGAYAQYALASTQMLAHKPRRDFLESAAVPVVAVTARQMLFREARVRAGDRVLVQGAAGNVGAYAVQFAHMAGAHVIASVVPRDKDEALRLGADEAISIPSEEAQGLWGTLDAAIDTVGGDTQRKLFEYLRKGGTLVSSVSEPDTRLSQQYGIEARFILVDVNTEDLKAVADFLDAQAFVVRIGQVLPLGDARRAHEMLDGLRPLPPGKVVLDAMSGS